VTEGKGVRTVRHFRRARGDDGAAAVEFALLFPIFMILALGIINGGLAFSRQINVTQAAREASRFGATLDITVAGGMSNWLDQVDNAVTASAGNSANPIGGYTYRCVGIVTRDSGGAIVAAKTAYKQTYTGSASTKATSSATGCPSVTPPRLGSPSTAVQVVLSRESQFFVLFINPTLQLDAQSYTPYEGAFPP
jgi:Flp pilus assembly protein TadG